MAAAPTLKLAFILSATDKMSRIVDEAVRKSTDRLSSFERTTSKIGRSMMKAGTMMVGAGAAVGGAMYGVAKSTANYGDEVLKTSQRVGVAVEDWERMAYAARFSNVEQNFLAETVAKLNKRVSDAAGGNKAYMQTFKDLGIQVKNGEGKLRSPVDILNDLADVFYKVEDGPAKTALAMEFFGETGSKLIPFLNNGRDGLKALGDEAERTGNMIGSQAAQKCKDFNNNLNTLGGSFGGLKTQIGAAFIPILDELVVKFNAGISKATEWIKENPKLAGTIGKVGMVLAGLLVTVGSASLLIGGLTFIVGKFGTLFRGVSNAIKIGSAVVRGMTGATAALNGTQKAYIIGSKLAAAAQWVFNGALYGCPMIWIVAAIMAVIAAVVLLVKYWDDVVAFFKRIWAKIVEFFSAAWEGVKKVWGAVAGWFAKIWDGIKNGISKGWNAIKTVFLNFTPAGLIIKHWDKITAFFSKVWQGIKNGVSKGWGAIKTAFLNYTPLGLIIKHWDKITAFFSNLWGKIKDGISNAWNGIKDWFTNLQPVEWIRGAWDSVGEFFGNLGTRFYEWGKSLLQGLWNGITSMVDKIVESIKNIARKIANGFKSFFGINSPSRLFAEYGLNISQGLIVGIDQGGNAVEHATESMAARATRGMTQNIQTSTVDASNVVNMGNSGVSLTYSPQITINGTASQETHDEFAKLLRQNAKEIISIIDRQNANAVRLSFNY